MKKANGVSWSSPRTYESADALLDVVNSMRGEAVLLMSSTTYRDFMSRLSVSSEGAYMAGWRRLFATLRVMECPWLPIGEIAASGLPYCEWTTLLPCLNLPATAPAQRIGDGE